MFIPLYLELWHCIYHILLAVGARGSGPGENSGHPGEDGGYAERAGRIWKEKKTETDKLRSETETVNRNRKWKRKQ